MMVEVGSGIREEGGWCPPPPPPHTHTHTHTHTIQTDKTKWFAKNKYVFTMYLWYLDD